MKAGFAGLIGMPNAGKSSLMNAIVGESVSIITAKPQTTRGRIFGIWNLEQGHQIVLTDAPGLVADRGSLNKFLHAELKSIIHDSDVLVAVIGLDEKKPENVGRIFDLCRESKKPWIVALTKCDLKKHHKRVGFIKTMLVGEGIPVFEFAVGSDGTFLPAGAADPLQIADFAIEITKRLPESPRELFDRELFTPSSQRDLIREFIREQIFIHLDQEIPYGAAVRVRQYDETKKIHEIHADILVAKESHRGVVIGRNGDMVKKIGAGAREKFEKMVGDQIYLNLNVQVRAGWTENRRLMEELGYAIKE